MTQDEFHSSLNQRIDQLYQILLHISFLLYGTGFVLVLISLQFQGTARWMATIQAGLFLMLGFVYYPPLNNYQRMAVTERDPVNRFTCAMSHMHVTFSFGLITLAILAIMAIRQIVKFLT